MGKILIIVFLVLIKQGLYAQRPIEKPYIIKDASISNLLDAHKQLNQRHRGMAGFRVQIYTDSGNRSKLRTEMAKAEFDARNLGVRSYISYDEPYFKVRVGDFRTRLDAQGFLNQIASTYRSAIIVVDRINFPPLTELQPANNPTPAAP